MDKTSFDKNQREIEKLKIKVLTFDEKKGFTSEIKNLLLKIQGEEIPEVAKPVEPIKVPSTPIFRKKDKDTFVDREDELKMCFDLIEGKSEHKAICFYGFGGRGLTGLLKRFNTDATSIKDNPIKILQNAPLVGGVQSLAGYLRSMSTFEEISNSKEDEMFYHNFVNTQDNLCILIDDFPYNDDKFVRDFNNLLSKIVYFDKNIYFIITCRDNPFFDFSKSFVKSYELKGFLKEDFLKYIEKNKEGKNPEFYEWILKNIDRVHQISKGYPKIINIILSNPLTKSSIEKGSIEDFFKLETTMNSIMKEIYDSIKNDNDTISALEILTILSIYESEWKEEIPREILGSKWGDIKSKLQSMALLTFTSEGYYKLDEYIAAKYLSINKHIK